MVQTHNLSFSHPHIPISFLHTSCLRIPVRFFSSSRPQCLGVSRGIIDSTDDSLPALSFCAPQHSSRWQPARAIQMESLENAAVKQYQVSTEHVWFDIFQRLITWTYFIGTEEKAHPWHQEDTPAKFQVHSPKYRDARASQLSSC